MDHVSLGGFSCAACFEVPTVANSSKLALLAEGPEGPDEDDGGLMATGVAVRSWFPSGRS